MSFDRLYDPNALLLVIGGTLIATLLRCGWTELRHTARMIRGLFRRRFSETRVRAGLAAQVRHINAVGVLRAEISSISDPEFAEALDEMLHHRSLDAMRDHLAARRTARERISGDAVRVLNLAADLAPVFGLAGTLVALSQLPSGGLAREAISAAVSAAVLTTLYGVLSANFIYAPLARRIGLVAEKEEADRQLVVDWMVSQLDAPPFNGQQPGTARPRLVRSRTA